MKSIMSIIILACIGLGALLFYWFETQETAKLKGLVDLQQGIIYERQIAYAEDTLEYKTEIDHLYEMLQQQSDTIQWLQFRLDTEITYASELDALLDRWEQRSISGWAYKPWQSKPELKDWLRTNDVSKQEFIPIVHDCDDFAYDLFWDALEDDRVIGIMAKDYHMFNFAVVGDAVYRIEPQNDVVKKLGIID